MDLFNLEVSAENSDFVDGTVKTSFEQGRTTILCIERKKGNPPIWWYGNTDWTWIHATFIVSRVFVQFGYDSMKRQRDFKMPNLYLVAFQWSS